MFDFSSMKTRLVMAISGVSLASTILIGGFFIFENVRYNEASIASYRQDRKRRRSRSASWTSTTRKHSPAR